MLHCYASFPPAHGAYLTATRPQQGILPRLHTDFDIDKTAQGVLGGAFMGGYALFSPIFGHLVQYHPPFLLMTVGLGTWVVSTLLASASSSSFLIVVAPRPLVRLWCDCDAFVIDCNATVMSL